MTRKNSASTSTNGIFGNTRSEASHLPKRRAAPPEACAPAGRSDMRALTSAIGIDRHDVDGVTPARRQARRPVTAQRSMRRDQNLSR